jgi:hypothetical protein
MDLRAPFLIVRILLRIFVVDREAFGNSARRIAGHEREKSVICERNNRDKCDLEG